MLSNNYSLKYLFEIIESRQLHH